MNMIMYLLIDCLVYVFQINTSDLDGLVPALLQTKDCVSSINKIVKNKYVDMCTYVAYILCSYKF